MKKLAILILAVLLCLSLSACGKNENSAPLVNNPPQSEQLSYETNKNGYITSCTLSIDGETFTYQCEGDNYLLIDDTDGKYVISEESPIADSYIGASESVKRIYFYEGTAQEFVIQDFEHDDLLVVGTRIQVFNRDGQIIVDQTPRQNIDNYYFTLSYQPGPKTPLLDTSKDALLTGNAQNLGWDEKAIIIQEFVQQKIENGLVSNGRLTSSTYYDIETGKVIYSCIYNVDTTYAINIYDRNDYHLVYRETFGFDTLTKRFYNADGSYYEKVTDHYEREVLSEGNYDANGTLILQEQN